MKGSLCWRKLASAVFCARQYASHSDRIFTNANVCCNLGLRPFGLKPVHRARKTPVSHPPSIRWRMASLILYARYAGIFPGQCPISKIGYVGNPGSQRACSLQTVNTQFGTLNDCVAMRHRCWLRPSSVERLRVSPRPSDSAIARSRGAARLPRSRCAALAGSALCPACAG